jgi:hypothetical protein
MDTNGGGRATPAALPANDAMEVQDLSSDTDVEVARGVRLSTTYRQETPNRPGWAA